ncbi:MAG: glycosyltransferase family 4 protein [Xanthobacteraceae bacterium]
MSDNLASRDASPRRLLFLVTEDWYFWAHRLHLARAARDAGYEVVVATRAKSLARAIEAEGFRLEPLSWQRGSINPLRLIFDLWTIVRLYRRLRPDIVHHVSLKPIMLGTAAARSVPNTAVLNALTGRGYIFTARSVRARVLAPTISFLLRLLSRRPNTVLLLENEDDRRFVVDTIGIPAERTAVTPGSGVDMRQFAVLPMPPGEPVAIGCAARMVHLKGIADLVSASHILRARKVAHRLVLAGATDRENPDAIAEHTLHDWVRQDGIEWLGRIDDVRELWRQCHIAALASLGGEGVPLSLVEAAACGRPLVATDVPGSRDIARADVNALLTRPGSPELLADALERLIRDHALRNTFAAESRRIAETVFSLDRVLAGTLALYDKLLSRPSS